MPLTGCPHGFLSNRRSCEGSISKTVVDMNHRSIQSDPGVCFELIKQRLDSTLINDRIMRQLEEARSDIKSVVMRRSNAKPSNLLSSDAGFCESYSRRGVKQTPGFRYYPTKHCLPELDSHEYVLPAGRRRNTNNRRVYVLDSQILSASLSNSGRVKSTSLSSSATSLYSEDDFVRSSINPSPVPNFASECPSIISGSSRSLCDLIDEDETENFSAKDEALPSEEYTHIQVKDNNEDHGVVKIDGNLIWVNLHDFRQDDKHCISELTCESTEESVVSSSLTEDHKQHAKLKDSIHEKEDADDDDELEQCAISEFWRFEEDARRWSRMDSKASTAQSPNARFSVSSRQSTSLDGIQEDANDVFTNEHPHARESDDANDGDSMQKQFPSSDSDAAEKLVAPKVLKPKPNNFLKRLGGDLKNLSFRKKEMLQRMNASETPVVNEHAKTSKPKQVLDNKGKNWKKNRKIVIGEPMLQSGHEKLDQMRCVPIEVSGTWMKELQNQHRNRKGSSHSLISSSSSSGDASTASTPAFRSQTFPEDLTSAISNDLSGRSHVSLDLNPTARNAPADRGNTMFVIPQGYQPGTFPSAIRKRSDQEELAFSSSSPSSSRSHSTSDSHNAFGNEGRRSSRPMSVYDNLPDTALHGDASAQDIINIMDPGTPLGGVDDSAVYDGSQESLDVALSIPDIAFWSVDDIVEHTQSLQEIVRSWEETSPDEEKSEMHESNSSDAFDRHIAAATGVLPSYSSENVSALDEETDATNFMNGDHRAQLRPRWQSFTRDHAQSVSSHSLQLDTLSVGQLMILRRLSVLKLTALMESYAFSNNNKGGFNWSVPRFIRRNKVPDYKDKNIFGVPLLYNVQRFGQPLPHCIQHGLAFLRRTALDQVGLFRKPGVRSRIQKLKARCEENSYLSNFDDCSAYDVADMVKQYFRELPDPLMTMKFSETFVGIFLYVPAELRLQTLQAATMLLPDETRETLKTLLCFLSDVASNATENHMNESNLSTCFAPSLFYQPCHHVRMMALASGSPKVRKSHASKNQALALGKPDIREMNENKAANQCLAFMIRHRKNLFKTSEDAMTQCRISVMQQTEDVLASEIGNMSDHHDEKDYYDDLHAYVDRTVAQTLREEQRISQNKGGWQTVTSAIGSELSCKKVNDGNPLRIWRSQVEVNGANTFQIMERILHERHLWDEDLLQWKVLQQPDDRTQLFQTVRAEMSPHPTRDYCVMRSWRTDINSRGAAAIVETSTGQPSLLGDIRGVILSSRYIIEPTDDPERCTLTHVTRVDTKGRNPEWYNKAYGHVVTQQLLRISESLRIVPSEATSSLAS